MRRWRRRARSAAAMVVLGAVMAGCAAAPSQRHPSRAPASLAAHQLVPPGGSPAEAQAVGERMLAGIVLPPGARGAGPRRRPARAEIVGSDDLVDVSRFYWLPLPLAAASSFLLAHVPAGETASGTGSGNTGPGGAGFFMSVSYALKRPPAGIDQNTMLLATLAAGPHGGTIMRADAEVVWYPPRSAAEYLSPSAYRQVTITAMLVSQRGRARTVTKAFGRPVIARLARVLNRLRTLAPPGPISCPAMTGSAFSLRFAPVSARTLVMVIGRAGCVGETVTVAGKAQPVLLDFESQKIIAVIGPLLGVRRPYW